MSKAENISLRTKDAAEFLGISLPTLWRWLKERPDFPQPIRLSARCTVFDQAALAEWRDRKSDDYKHEPELDLLEALRVIAGTDPVDAALDPQRAIRVARAAIAKALGEPQ